MSRQSIDQLKAAQRNGRRFHRNAGVTQACLRELRKRPRTVEWLSKRTGYPLRAVKNALHHLQQVIGGVTSSATGNGTERLYALYQAPVRNVDSHDFTRAAPIVIGRGSRWWTSFG